MFSANENAEIVARSGKHVNAFKIHFLPWFNFSGLKSTKILKTTGRTGKDSVFMEMQLIISVSVSPLEL